MVLQNQLSKLKEPAQTLRLGQIIQGHILKLYPNNKAHIQLGMMQLIAQLEASLEIGNKYHFQVQSMENMTHLKVLGDPLPKRAPNEMNATILLRQIGLNNTKAVQEFVAVLLHEKIPFDKGQIQQAIPLIESSANKEQAKAVLKEMIVNRMPITDSVFQALSVKQFESFTETIKAIEYELRQNHTGYHHQITSNNLNKQLHQLTGNTGQIQIALINTIAENPEIFNVLKAIGIIDDNIPFSTWSSRVKQNPDGVKPNITHYFNVETVKQLQTIISQLDKVHIQANTFLNNWGNVLQTSIMNQIPLSEEAFTMLQNELNRSIFQHIPMKHMELVNHPKHLQTLASNLEVLGKQENFVKIDHFLQHFIKESFTEQVRTVLQDVGLQYEKAILQDEKNPLHSLKGMVLQLIQSSDGVLQEQGTKLLQFINGLQLQSYSETDKMLQANLLLPGEGLGLDKDVALSFEGKKDEDGKINPDYCRVVFFLDLTNLEETIVDMQVQKRSISITILNDHPINTITQSLKPLLKEGLQRLDYHLSNITLKPLVNQKDTMKKQNHVYKNQPTSYQGVDYRI